MESAFGQNFVCCAIPLRDLHDLLEHFEQAHCQAGDIAEVDGFEGLTLDQMAAGVGFSAEFGLDPGNASQNNNSDPNARHCGRSPSVSVNPRAASFSHTLHELRFEDEEESSSGHDTSTRSGSPAHVYRSPLQSHSEMQIGPEVEEDTMTRLGKTLRETLGTLRPNPITIDRSRNSSNSRSRSGSLSESHDDGASAADRVLSDLIASFRSKARGNRHDPLQSSRHLRHDNGKTAGYLGPIEVAPTESNGRNDRMEGGAIDPALVLESRPFEGGDGIRDSLGDDDIPDHLKLDPEQLLKHQQQQRRRRRPNVDPVTGLTPTGRLPLPWTPVSAKPFKCSVPGCEQAYRQQNGLKYHKIHGHSSPTVLTADTESKAFICHDIVCGKRYTHMNGLRYHYQHTGPHGALGIQLLSLGAHPPPQYPPGHKKSLMINSSNPSFCPPASSEKLGTLRPNPITRDRSRNSSNSRSQSDSLSEPHDDGGSAADRALSHLIASFRSKVRANQHDHLQSSRHPRHDDGNTAGVFGRIGVAPSELDGRNHRMEGGAIDPALVLENRPFEGTDGLTDSFGDDDIPDHLQLDPALVLENRPFEGTAGLTDSFRDDNIPDRLQLDPALVLENRPFEGADGLTDSFRDDDIPDHLQLDPEQLLKHQQQQRLRRRPNVDPVTGLTPTGRLPRPWTPVSEKPFKCSVPGCEKAYKQQSGLKYHKTHGHPSQTTLTADAESKPFICHDIVCGKRYKNIYSLRSHYQNTGPHGALGIQLLLLGAHPHQYHPRYKKSSMINSRNPSFCPGSSGSSPPSS